MQFSLPSFGARWRGIATFLAVALPSMDAAPLRLTGVVRDVKVQAGAVAAQRARVNDVVPDGASVRTGADSRAELGFAGSPAIVRLAANTGITTGIGGPAVQLVGGALLFHANRGTRGPKITTAGIHVAAGGSTGIIERNGAAYVKILVLEGTARVYLDRVGESVLVEAGQLLITKPGTKVLPEAVHYDIGQLYKTSVFTTSGFPPLASAGAIERAIRKQKSDPDFTRTNLVIFGRGTLVNLLPPPPETAATAGNEQNKPPPKP